AADYAGSTSGMITYVGQNRPKRVVLMTECSMSDNVAVEYPDVSFVRPCNLCPHMKRITLPKILHSLQTMTTEVTVEPLIAARAPGVICGLLAADLTFKLIDAAILLAPHAPDGSEVARGETIVEIEGPARAILTAERVALNFMGHLSGVATATHRLVVAVAG